MHAIVNNHAVSYDRLRKLQRVQEIEKMCLSVENGTTESALNRVSVVCWVDVEGWGVEDIKQPALPSRPPLT